MLYMGPEQSSVEPTLPSPTPEECKDFERRAKAFEQGLARLSRKHGIVVGIENYDELGFRDPKHDELWRGGLEWSDDAQAYKWWE